MARKLPEPLTGKTVPIGGLPGVLNLQWHITARCQVGCRHCYMYSSPTYESEIKNELSLENIIKVMDQYKNYLDKKGLKGNLSFTGGDPLLRKDLSLHTFRSKKKRFYAF